MKKLFAVLTVLILGLSFVAAKPKSIEGEVFKNGKSFSVKAFLSSKIEYKKDGSKKVTLYDKDGKSIIITATTLLEIRLITAIKFTKFLQK